MFIPSQVSRTIIGSNTYSQVQQKLHQNIPTGSSIPPPPTPPTFISTFNSSILMSQELPEKSYSTEPTPVVLSSAPKLYTNRPTVSSKLEIHSVPQAPPVSILVLIIYIKTKFSFFLNFLD